MKVPASAQQTRYLGTCTRTVVERELRFRGGLRGAEDKLVQSLKIRSVSGPAQGRAINVKRPLASFAGDVGSASQSWHFILGPPMASVRLLGCNSVLSRRIPNNPRPRRATASWFLVTEYCDVLVIKVCDQSSVTRNLPCRDDMGDAGHGRHCGMAFINRTVSCAIK